MREQLKRLRTIKIPKGINQESESDTCTLKAALRNKPEVIDACMDGLTKLGKLLHPNCYLLVPKVKLDRMLTLGSRRGHYW